jgi:hypothetical protein
MRPRRKEEEADRHLMARLREKAGQLDTQLRALRIAQEAGQAGVQMKPTNLTALARESKFDSEKYVGGCGASRMDYAGG